MLRLVQLSHHLLPTLFGQLVFLFFLLAEYLRFFHHPNPLLLPLLLLYLLQLSEVNIAGSHNLAILKGFAD